MTFNEVLNQTIVMLQQHGRVSYRALKRQFEIDDTYLEDLTYELIEIHQVATEQDGKMLIWAGDAVSALLPEPWSAAVPAPAPQPQEPPPASEPVAVSEGERRQATILFSDLSGYTTMNERLDPEEVGSLMDRLKTAAVQIVERHGGMVNQFVGDEVLALFGIPTAHEDDPLRAIRAALELHALIRQLSPEVEARIGQPLRIHTGIHTGLIVTNVRDDRDGRYGVIGDTVNTGARLKAQADVDEILISAETQHLAAPFVDTQALPAVSMKGKAAPVMSYRVIGESAIHTRFEAAAQRGFTTYTGRERELNTLHSCLDQALGGQGQFVSVMSEAGVGKSRLLYEFCHGLDRERITVVQGRCQSYLSTISYVPFLDALRRGLGLRPEDTSAVLQEKAVANITAINPSLEQYLPLYLHLLSIPSDDDLPEHLQGEQLRYVVQEALAALLTLNAKRQPMVLILEDWQWADEASEATLHHLIGVIAQSPLMLMVTYRPYDTPSWGNLTYHTRMMLTPLDAVHTEGVSKSVVGATHLPAGLGALIYQRTGGNPFFIEEACRSLSEEGVIVVQGGQAVLTQDLKTLTLPDTVQAIIRSRLDRLDADAKEAVGLACVIGRIFSGRLLERLYTAQTPLPLVLETLKALEMIQQTQVFPEAEFTFKHVLTQEVAYETLLLQRRKTLHGLIGEAIEALYPDRLEEQAHLLQHHFSLAESWPKAVRYGRQSAEKTAQLSQFHEAIDMLEQVQVWLSRLPIDRSRQETRIDILLLQERYNAILGRLEQQQALIDQLFDLLQASDDAAGLAEVYVRQGELNVQLSRFEAAEGALGEALRLRRSLADAAGESHTLRSMGFLRLHQGLYEEAMACNEAALRIDRQRGDAADCATDLTNLGTVLHNLGDYERAIACLEEAIELCETIQAPGALGVAVYTLGSVHRKMGDLDRALANYQRTYDIRKQGGDKTGQAINLATQAAIYWEQRKTDESRRHYQDAIQMAREICYTQMLSQVLRSFGGLLLALDEPREALPYFIEAATVFTERAEREPAAEAWIKVADIYEHTLADYPEALAAWDKAWALRKQGGDRHGVLETLQQMGRLARQHLGDPVQALPYIRDALEIATEIGDRAKQGELLNTLGIIAWQQAAYADALVHYEQALQIYRDLREAAPSGLMLNSIGVTLQRLGRYDEALAHLQVAVATNRQAGQPLLEGHGLAAMGDIYRELGEYEQARPRYQASCDIRRDIGDRQGEGWMRHALAQVFAAQNLHTQAHDNIEQALIIAQECADENLRRACIQVQDQLPKRNE